MFVDGWTEVVVVVVVVVAAVSVISQRNNGMILRISIIGNKISIH